MDSAYDHIQEENFPKDPEPTSPKAPGTEDAAGAEGQAPPVTLNDEFQEAYKAMASSPWGMKIGGLWGTVKKAVRSCLCFSLASDVYWRSIMWEWIREQHVNSRLTKPVNVIERAIYRRSPTHQYCSQLPSNQRSH